MLELFADASFGQGDAKSQTGTVIALGGQPLGWLSLPQTFVALSAAEAEIIVCTESMVLAQALRPLVEEIVDMPVTWTLLNDNVACNSVLSYPAGGWRTRHMRIRSAALQELISDDQVRLHHVPGRFMLGDLLTKGLAPLRVKELLTLMGCDLSKVDCKAKANNPLPVSGSSPAPGVLILSLLAIPCQAQGRESMSWFPEVRAWLVGCLVECMFLIGVVSLWRQTVRRARVMCLRQLADEVLAEAMRDNEPEAEPALSSRPWNGGLGWAQLCSGGES